MPLPKPTDTDTREEFVNRCMANETMITEFPDTAQRSAVCNSMWADRNKMSSRDVVDKFKNDQRAQNGMDVEIFAVGKWNGLEFDAQDLKTIVLAFHTLGDNHHVPLKFGHNEDQPFTDGYPAIGWVSDVWMDGDKLMARFTDVPDIVKQTFEKKLYRHVSIELEVAVEYKGQFFPWVLSGVALLGADIPAVNTLSDLAALMKRDVTLVSKERRVFTTFAGSIRHGRSDDMPDELKEMKAKFQASEDARIAAERRAKELEDNAKKKEREAEAKFCSDKRTELTKRLDVLVEGKRILPARREAFIKELADDRIVLERVEFAVTTLEEATKDTSTVNDDGGTKLKGKGADDEKDMRADAVLMKRINKLRGETDLTFTQAKERVLRADPALAREYIEHAWDDAKGGEAA